jgi:cytosine/adenosine deaminase-related metal-dependent hydrolase
MSGVLVRAQYLLSMDSPPVENGGLFFMDGQVLAAGRFNDLLDLPFDEQIDLGEGVLFPGLINLHCHLNLTGIPADRQKPPGFAAWARQMVDVIGQWSDTDAASAIQSGLRQLLRNSGCTTVLDHRPMGVHLHPRDGGAGPLPRVLSSMEFGGVLAGVPTEYLFEECRSRCEALLLEGGKGSLNPQSWLSPHAPYSVSPGLLQQLFTSNFAAAMPVRYSIHVSESADEQEYFSSSSGAMWEWLQGGAAISPVTPQAATPLGHLIACGLPPQQSLLVHANFLSERELSWVRERGCALVHCPRSHHFFGHGTNPVRTWEKLGIQWGIGTDSLATVCGAPADGSTQLELSLLEEARVLQRQVPSLSPSRILYRLTAGAAAAMGLRGNIGVLAGRAVADFNFMPFDAGFQPSPDRVAEDLAEIILAAAPGAFRTFIAGVEVTD